MKKLLSVLVIAGFATLVACGPSAEEIAAKEKAKQDSIAQADSIKAAEEAAIAAEQAKQDSIANAQRIADSIASAAEAKKSTKSTKTTKPATTDPTKVKAGQGKG